MKLQIAQAKLEALETARDSADEKGQLAPEVDTNHKVQNFLKSQVVNNELLLEKAAGPSLTGSDFMFCRPNINERSQNWSYHQRN